MCSEAVDISPSADGGVLKQVLREGSGSELPAAGCRVSVHYTGTLLDGTRFDSSRDRNEPFEFILGKGSVIQAWDIGVATMRRGELCMLTCKPQYAYGASGSPPSIPPDSTLQFEIEMLSWQGEDLSPKKNNGIVRYVVVPGSGLDHPNDGAHVEVDLAGRLAGGGDAVPFEERSVAFPLGEGAHYGVCEGVERALERFSRGETSRLVLQPRYAFREGNAALGVPSGAVVEYTVTLRTFRRAKDSWVLDNPERLEQAKIYKQKGTDYFKAGKYQLAVKMYKKCESFLSSDHGFEGSALELRNDLLLSAYLNLSLCFLKSNPVHPLEAKENANKALEIDPDNVKGLFRKGQALQAIGDCENAINAFQKVIAVEPNNKAAINQIVLCKTSIKQQKDKEKKIYANMFEKFAQKDRETEQRWAKTQPDVMGEALGEWGAGAGEWADKDRDRAPTEFEKENPNILMLDKDGQFQNM